jgi:hypothetical protein
MSTIEDAFGVTNTPAGTTYWTWFEWINVTGGDSSFYNWELSAWMVVSSGSTPTDCWIHDSVSDSWLYTNDAQWLDSNGARWAYSQKINQWVKWLGGSYPWQSSNNTTFYTRDFSSGQSVSIP